MDIPCSTNSKACHDPVLSGESALHLLFCRNPTSLICWGFIVSFLLFWLLYIIWCFGVLVFIGTVSYFSPTGHIKMSLPYFYLPYPLIFQSFIFMLSSHTANQLPRLNAHLNVAVGAHYHGRSPTNHGNKASTMYLWNKQFCGHCLES